MMTPSAPDTPTDLPKRSWLRTLVNTVREFKEDDLTDWAAALTYYGILSLFPALIALVSIVGIVVDPATVTRVLTDTVSSLGPTSAVDTFKGPIQSITSNQSRAGVMLVVGIALALWSASGYVGAFMRASNAIYETEEGRPFWKLRPLQLLVTLVLVLLMAVVALAVVLTGPIAQTIGDAVGLGSTAVTVWSIAKWPVLLVAVMFMLAILYWSSPNAKPSGFRWVSPGGVLAVVVWLIVSGLFALYVANFSSYDKTYGALGGVVVFLIWMWLSNIAVLLGAELNAELERTRQVEAGVEGADRKLRMPRRDEPKGERGGRPHPA